MTGVTGIYFARHILLRIYKLMREDPNKKKIWVLRDFRSTGINISGSRLRDHMEILSCLGLVEVMKSVRPSRPNNICSGGGRGYRLR